MISLDNYQKARARLLINHIFFATIVLSTEFVAEETIPTACTDMKKVWYNPKFMNSLDVETCMFVIVHEIMHVILMHGFRKHDKDHQRWNIACDYAINLQLKDNGFRLWEECYVDEKYRGMSAEQIYEALRNDPQPPGGGGLGEDLRDAPSDPAERAVVERQIKQRIVQAATAARAAGKLPAGMELIVDGIVNPPLPWYALLRDYMTRTVNEVETWTRRNRRYTTMLPSRHNLGMGPFVFIGDTSGSMLEDHVFAQAGAEMEEAREQVKPERVIAVWADHADCSHEEIFEPGEPIVLHPRGGGGTDMRLPLKYVEKYEPAVVILLTDCETPWPDQPTPFPLIVLATGRAGSPDWAQRVEVR